jgi:hypothetical protein
MLRHLLGADATADTMLEAIARDARETGFLGRFPTAFAGDNFVAVGP